MPEITFTPTRAFDGTFSVDGSDPLSFSGAFFLLRDSFSIPAIEVDRLLISARKATR